MSLTDTISTASVFAARAGAEVDGNREMVGVGAANVAAGFFQGFPVSTSGSRTAVAAQNGAKTQVTGLVGATAILLLLIFAPGLLRDLPQPALAAVVIAASMSLADIRGLRRLRRQRRSDFLLAMAAFLGVAFLGVLPGIGIAVGLSIINVFRRAWRPHQAVLGRVEGWPGTTTPSPPHNAPPAWSSHLPVRRPAVLRECTNLPRPGPASREMRAPPAVDRGGSRADHRCRHHRGRRAGRSLPPAERRRDQPGLRRTQDPRPSEDRRTTSSPRPSTQTTSSKPSPRPSGPSASRPERNGPKAQAPSRCVERLTFTSG